MMRMVLTTLVFVSFLVLAPPIRADESNGASTEGIEAPGDETAPPVDPQPPAEPSEPGEDEEGSSN